MNMDEYLQLPGMSWSQLSHMRASPAHYRYRLEHPLPPTPAMTFGSAVHCAVLEPDDFPRRYVVYREPKNKGKGSRTAWNAFQRAHEHDTILSVTDYDTALAIRDAIRAHPVADALLAEATDRELVIQWRANGRPWKSRLDLLTPSAVVDLKTTHNCSERSFVSDALKYGYHAQIASYLDATAAYRGEPDGRRGILLAVETSPPHDVAVYVLSDSLLNIGRQLYRSLADRLEQCEAADHWPGRHPAPVELEPPPWATATEDPTDEVELIIGGESCGL